MKNKVDPYNKMHDTEVLSLSTHETLVINPQISHTIETDDSGEHEGPDNIIIVFSATDPVSIEEREAWHVDPNEPLVVLLETMEQTDSLIKSLQELRTRIWGLNLDYGNNKN